MMRLLRSWVMKSLTHYVSTHVNASHANTRPKQVSVLLLVSLVYHKVKRS
ncbi:hypothetical protein MGSAQ_002125 [marine sediment metagenome]|uniref:Uncharacterized protein n=1 Tax=marine sediment metagenome TaxID=412755 RepID=A0A1B6NSE0_9ZZZZ